jgi:hypothetical protein
MRELYTEQHTSAFTLFNHVSQYVGMVCLKTDLQATSFKNIPPLRLSSSYPILRNNGNGIPARYLIRVRTQMYHLRIFQFSVCNKNFPPQTDTTQ